ncbi:MAG TPA: hypothetical protein VF546_24525 [Pyrinomonadaceae bacterium]|jgi:hypothetical protein
MNELGITKTGRLSGFSRKGGFWRRQFAAQETLSQLIFDGTFGVVAPLLCVIFDPVVFRGGLFGERALLGAWRVCAYLIIFVEIAALLAWLAGRRTHARARVLGGVMLAGALFSAVVGLALLPYSLLGILFAGLGLCGFTPFVTAIIYLRNGRRALRHAGVAGRAWRPVLLCAALTLAVPLATQWQVTRLVRQNVDVLVAGDAGRGRAVETLRVVHRLTGENLDELVWAYQREPDAARRARLAAVYAEITGADIETRVQALID